MTNIEEQLKEIREVVYRNKETNDRIEATQDRDREDISQVRIELANLKTEVAELRKLVRAQPGKVQDRVSEVLQPMVDATGDLSKQIEKKRFKILREPFSFKKLFRE